MKISSTTISQTGNRNYKANQVSFKTYSPEKALVIEKELAQKGVFLNSNGNNFVAECVRNVINLFRELFGQSYLPKNINFVNLTNNAYGTYENTTNTVNINKRYEYGCYYDLDSLTKEMKEQYKFLKPNWTSSLHPAHTFVHEFSHAAHWHHLKERNGEAGAERVWRGLEGVTVPNAIGRLIARFKLSDYAVKGDDMCEFMAERMSQDICNGLTDLCWLQYRPIDVGYSDLFYRKWDYRYSRPQSYIDYFSQQVWNGDIEEANRVGDKIQLYLEELDAQRVAPVVAQVQEVTVGVPLLERVGDFFATLSEGLTDFLDSRNKLRLNE